MKKTKSSSKTAPKKTVQKTTQKAAPEGKNPLDTLRAIYDIKDEHVSPRIVLHAMMERLEAYIKIVYQIIQPEEFHSLHECNAFDDVEKQQLFELYKQLMILHRELLKMDIGGVNLPILQAKHTEITALQPKLLHIVNKIQGFWKADTKKGVVGYIS